MRTKLIFLTLCLFPFSIFAQTGYVQEGKASFYADKFEGRTTASGERYSHARSTCAHLTLPFGTLVRVTNLANNQSIIVRVNDRGPFVPNRIIDLSRSAAEKLGFINQGVADVRVEVVDEDGKIMATQPNASAPAQRPAEASRPQQQPVTQRPAETSRPQQQPVAQRPTPVQEPTAAPVQVAPKPPAPAPAPSVVTSTQPEIELYDLKVTKQQPSGFTVQIGSYKELANLLRIADDLRTSLKKEVRVQVATINGEKVYRLMVGEFSSRRDAEAFRTRAAQLYPDCFIVELK